VLSGGITKHLNVNVMAFIYVSVPVMRVVGKYGGDNPVEYLVRFRTICDISVSFSCGVGGAGLLLKACHAFRY
jgi:hypothetical protein